MAQSHERAPLLGDVEDPQDDGLLRGGNDAVVEKKDGEKDGLVPKKTKEVNYKELSQRLAPENLMNCCCNMLSCDGKDCIDGKSKTGIAIFWGIYAPLAAGFIFLNIWMIILWNNHRHDKLQCKHDLPGWLFISGVTGLAGWFLSLLGRGLSFIPECETVEKGKEDSTTTTWGKAKLWIFGISLAFGMLMIVFDIAWSTLGFWGVMDIPQNHPGCAAALYDFTKYYLIAYWAVLGAALITVGVLCCVIASRLSERLADYAEHIFKDSDVKTTPAPAAAAVAAQ